MEEVYGLTSSEIKFLNALAGNDVPFMIVGLSAAAMQGAPVVTQDIDLWFKRLDHPGVKVALAAVGAAYVAPTIHQPPMFAGRGVEQFDIVMHMSGLGEFEEEMLHTIPLKIGESSVPVLALARILASKKAAGREKDRLTIQILADVLAVREQKKSTDPDAHALDSATQQKP